MRNAVPAIVPNARRFGVPSWAIGCGVFAVTLLAHVRALRGEALWDDAAHITARGLQSFHGLWDIWFKLGATQQYYPVLHSAFWLEHRVWGDAALGYHLVNVGLHATGACLFALVLSRMRGADDSRQTPGKIDWLAAAIFALHPVCVESVAWISEQKNTLSLVFYLLSALVYLRFDRERSWPWYALALVLFGLAVLTKSVTATLPAALLLMRYWQCGTLDWKRDWVPLLPWFVLGVSAGLVTAWVEQRFIGAQGATYELTFLERGFLAGRAIWFYLGKLLWPANLVFIYPHWTVVTTLSWSLGAAAIVALLGALWRLRHWNRGPLVAFLFFAGSLFPALGFVYVYPFRFSYVADHWQYLPSLGVIAFGVLGIEALVRRGVNGASGEKTAVVRRAGGLLSAAVVGIFFLLTWRQAGNYRTDEILYQDTLRKNPECWLAHNNLGLLRLDSGRVFEAIDYFKAALCVKPDCADAYNNLGNAYAKIPDHAAESIAAFEQALRNYPDMAEAHGNLGWALVNASGRFDEGVAHLRRALQLRPDFYRAHNSLGLALSKLPSGLPDAVAEFEAALAFDPDYAAARVNLGNALLTGGRVDEAIAQIELARQLEPGDPRVYYNLGLALVRAGRSNEAISAFERSLLLQPKNAETHDDLGNVLSEVGRDAEAIAHYRRALELDPNSPKTHFNLALALRSSGDGSEAVSHFQASLRLAPGLAGIWNSFGSFLFRLHRIPDAASAYREAIRLEPETPLFHNNLGAALTEMHRFEEAITPLHRAIALAPNYTDAHYNLGVAFQGAGRTEEAAAEFKTAGKSVP